MKSSASISASSTPRKNSGTGLPAAALATARAKGNIEAEGWRVRKDGTQLPRVGRDRSALRGRRPGRLRQDHPRHHGAARRRGMRCGTASGNFRLLVQRRHRLRDLHARSGRHSSSSWNAGGERIKGYAPAEIIGQHFSRFYTDAGPGRRPAGTRAVDRPRDGPLRGGRLARPQGRLVLLGQRRDRSDPRRRRQADRLRQDHPRHHRAPRGADGARAECSGSLPSRRRWTRSASSPAAWRTTSTTC